MALLGCAAAARADLYVSDMWDNGTVNGGPIFPNYTRLLVEDATINLSLGTAGTPEQITGMTVVNFGTATNADIKAVYVVMECGATVQGTLTLTYAGNYLEDSGSPTLPAWTWAGTTIDFSGCADLCAPCTTLCCGGGFGVQVYADIAACPTDEATVNMGFPTQTVSNTTWGGSVADNWGNFVPWGDVHPTNDYTIYYTYKEGPDEAAPGDTVNFTIYYGKPGANPLTSIRVFDSIPPYMHYIQNSAVPAADPGYDPLIGPPMALQWTLPGGAVAGGATGVITFAATVDWGNMESFEPGSGDFAAPEGSRLSNQAQAFFTAAPFTCVNPPYITPPVTTVVSRFLFYMLGDNDILFAGAPGQPADQITYTTFVKNVSNTKTWWNVQIWDTVPTQIDSWCVGCGFYDPCNGWTMSPSGCAAASPGYKLSGANTILTWKLDMPPGFTLSVQWTGQVKATASGGQSANNLLSLYEIGRNSIVDGTGNSGAPVYFVHQAPIVLQTTYASYVGFMAGSDDKGNCPGYYLAFFPLNKRNQFQLYGIHYYGATGFPGLGGVSQSIGCAIGDCLNGFPGNATCTLGMTTTAITGGGYAGCGPGRIPATYDPPLFNGSLQTCPAAFNVANIYKIISNAPLLWQLATHTICNCEDWATFAPSTTLTYRGFMHYTWRGEVTAMQSLDLINTGLDSTNTFNGNLTTVAHLFRYNYVTNNWDYMTHYNIGAEGHVGDITTTAADHAPWRVLSSQAALMIDVGFQIWSTMSCCCGGCGDNHGTFGPNRENGYKVNDPGVNATFYGVVEPKAGGLHAIVVVGNVGPTDASFAIDKYLPNSSIGNVLIPTGLRDTGGQWITKGQFTVGAGQANVTNPYVFNGPPFSGTGSTLFRARLLGGGPIQVWHGTNVTEWWSGGDVLHSASGTPMGYQFWFNNPGSGSKNDLTCGIMAFCAKQGMTVQMTSQYGYSAIYTTTGPDQAVEFEAITKTASGVNNNYIVNLTGGAGIVLYNQDRITEKGYTAPFLQLGTHYMILAPPIAFIGQSFWITVVVVDSTNSTKTDYCGTTSFTSTDPAAQMVGSPMDLYNYTWSSSIASCNGGAPVNGVHIFLNVTFSKLGFQTVVASDTTDGSITGLAAIQVVGVDVKLTKNPRLSIAASGDTVQFKVCWSNYSTSSAFSFVITDSIPQGTSYVPEVASAMYCGDTDGVSVSNGVVAYSTIPNATPPAFTALGAGAPPANTQWLRWTVPMAGIGTTGCACYRVTVN